MTNLQAKCARYEADNLNVHDEGLAFALEFGTNVVPNTPGEAGIGDVWNPSGEPDAPALIHARFGALQVFADGGASTYVPRGQSYLLPPWPITTPPQKFIMRVLYARLRRFEAYTADGAENTAELFLGPEDMIGAYDNGCASVGLEGGAPDDPFVLETVAVSRDWAPGACIAGTPGNNSRITLGNDLYLRFGLLLESPGDPKQETEVVIWASRTGMAWEFLSFTAVPGQFRRIALAACGIAKAQLDWVRLYEWSPQDFEAFSGRREESAPPTGGRLFGGAV
jgi:hypothetical protein